MLLPAPLLESDKFTVERITHWWRWAPNLFSFRTTRHRGFRFAPGQFARIGLPGADGKLLWRAYSIVSAPYDEHLEFYSILVPEGEFTPRLATLGEGDEVLVDKTNYGFLTTDRFEAGRDLWMLASGTGLAPFLSILGDPAVWQAYQHIILVHSVRYGHELAYQDTISRFAEHPLVAPFARRLRYLPVVTREQVEGALPSRITTLIEDGRLQARAGIDLDPEHSRVMVCGNPQMVEDLRALLSDRGLRTSRRGNPGQMAFENYW
jgi:ferredoxin--NADP+ reductase